MKIRIQGFKLATKIGSIPRYKVSENKTFKDTCKGYEEAISFVRSLVGDWIIGDDLSMNVGDVDYIKIEKVK